VLGAMIGVLLLTVVTNAFNLLEYLYSSSTLSRA
jgi:ribose/xylose/arabinose/galactoside ABC-type transport system permease subunit